MKYYIQKHYNEQLNGEFLNGISTRPFDGLGSSFVEVEMLETDDLFINQINYKYLNGEIIKMSEKEMKMLYPLLFEEKPLSNEEQQNDFNIDIDYRVSCLELGL